MKTKFAKFSTSLMFGAVMLMAATAFAAEKSTVALSTPVTANGNQLPAGNYTVVWEGAGPSVELKFMQGKKIVATVPAQMVKLNSTNGPNSIVTRKDNDHVTLTQVMPGGKKYALAIGGEAVTASDSNAK